MLKIASIGSGRRGRLAKLAHRPGQGTVLAAACDVSPAVREEYATQFPGIALFADYRDLLASGPYDAIFVTTPDYLHEEHGLAALATGAAVYLEKPLAITIDACDRLLHAAAQFGDRLYVGHNMRFFPVMQKMKELIDSGTIGQVQAVWCRHFVDYGGDAYFKDWHSERRHVGGLLLQKGAHDIDIIHWLAGSHTTRVVGMGKLSVYNQVEHRRDPQTCPPVRVRVSHWPPLAQQGMSPVIDVEDHSMMLMQLANGVQASYTQCHYTPDGWRNYTVIGTQGRIENWGDHSSSDLTASVRVYTRRSGRWSSGDLEMLVPAIEGEHGGADPGIVDDFLAFVRTGHRGGATPLDARHAVAAGYLATCSLREGNTPRDVPPFVPGSVAQVQVDPSHAATV
jgi:predicted dehydrogenase